MSNASLTEGAGGWERGGSLEELGGGPRSGTWRATLLPRDNSTTGTRPALLRAGTARAPCESEVTMKTGESPSPVETRDHRVPEGQLRRREAGWRAAGGEFSGPKSRINGTEPDSADRAERVCGAKTKLGARASWEAATPRVRRSTSHYLNVPGVSMRIRPQGDLRNETRAGADGSGAGVRAAIVAREHGKAVSAKGGRKVNT